MEIESRSVAEIYAGQDHVKTIKNGENDDFKGFATKPINNAFSWGIYGNFQLVIRNVDGYVNGTHLIKEAILFENSERQKIGESPIGRHTINEWCRNISTISLMNVLKQNVRNITMKLIDRVKGKTHSGEEMTLGTYIHPRLVNSLATWVSPSYALLVGDLMNQYHLKSKLSAEQNRIRELETDGAKKDDLIENLRLMYNSISEKFQVTIVNHNILMTEFGKTREDLRKNTQALHKTNNFLRQIAPEIRVQTYTGNEHLLVLCKLNSPSQTAYTYKSIRVLKNELPRRFEKTKETYPAAKIICELSTPNPIQIWKQFKKENKIQSSGVYFDYAGSESELISVITLLSKRSSAMVENVVN